MRVFGRREEMGEEGLRDRIGVEKETFRTRREGERNLIVPDGTKIGLIQVSSGAILGKDVEIVCMGEEVSFSGNVKSNGSLKVDCSMKVEGSLDLSGKSTFERDLEVSGSLSSKDSLVVKGTLKVNRDAEIGPNSRISGDLIVGGRLIVGNSSEILGKVSCNSNVKLGESCSIPKGISSDGDLEIGDKCSIGEIDVKGDVKVGKSCEIEEMKVNGGLEIGSSSVIRKGVEYGKSIKIGEGVIIEGTIRSRKIEREEEAEIKEKRREEGVLAEVRLTVVEASWSDERRDVVRVDPELIKRWGLIPGVPREPGYQVEIVSRGGMKGRARVYPIQERDYSGKGVVRVPRHIRKSLGLEIGDEVIIRVIGK